MRTCCSANCRQVMPAFVARVDQPTRGGRWVQYLADDPRGDLRRRARPRRHRSTPKPRDEVTLTEFDPDGEIKVVASALYAATNLPDDQLLGVARAMSADDRASVLRAYIGDRANRRHKPGRAFERTRYRFDVLADYGAFRDLQRHRLLTLEWQPLTPEHGYVEPAAIEEAGALHDWRAVMDRSADLYAALDAHGLQEAASYAVAMAYRVRFYMDMNAREAMHVIELRTAPQGHPSYRRVCQAMHRAIADVAGHHAIADAMQFADHSTVELERLQSERGLEGERDADGEPQSTIVTCAQVAAAPTSVVGCARPRHASCGLPRTPRPVVVLDPVAGVLVEEGQRLERTASDRRTGCRRDDRSRAG